MYDIDFLKFLDLNSDDSVTVDDMAVEGGKKIVTISRKPSPTFCPDCDSRIYSCDSSNFDYTRNRIL